MRSHRLWRALSERRGEGYVDVIVLVLCAVMVLALAMRVLPVFIQKQQLDTFATELVREAEVSGRVGAETSRRAAVLSEKTGLHPDILWSSHGRIQLNEEVTVILTMDTNIGLFGEFASFPVTLRAQAAGNEVEGLRKRMKEILRDRRASSFPMTIGIVLSLIILMCGISEYFRLQVIAAGVREAVEDAVIPTVNDNYAGVYHGVREGYSGSYVPFGEGSWEEDLNEGDIYDYLDETIGTQLSGGRHVKYADTGTAMEFAIDSLQVTLRNAPLAPSDPAHAQRFEADAIVRLEVPVRFGGRILPSMWITLKVQAGYTEVF